MVVPNLLPGSYWIDAEFISGASAATRRLFLQRILVDGADATGRDATLVGGDTIEVEFTDRPNRILGTVQAYRGVMGPAPVIALLPSNLDLVRASSPRMLLSPIDTAGQYSFSGMPAGDYLLIIMPNGTRDDLDDWNVIRHIASSPAARASVSDGAAIVVNLTSRAAALVGHANSPSLTLLLQARLAPAVARHTR
jgi:hypothetical protein